MSIDFSGITGVSDGYGVVTQIADASGAVLWKQAPSGATVTINVTSGFGGNRLLIDGVYYGNESTEITVPIGTVITVKGATTISLNGSPVSFSGDYNYTVIGDVLIGCTGTKPNPYYTVYVVGITEL